MGEWESKAAIKEVIDGYAGAAGRLDAVELVSFFTEGAAVYGVAGSVGLPDPLQGGNQLLKFFCPTFENLEWLSQTNNTTDIVLSADGANATAITGLLSFMKHRQAGVLQVVGRYEDILVLTSTGWKFTSRTLTTLFSTSIAS